MRWSDLLGQSAVALTQQKVRTLLTVAGVAIATFTLIVSISVGRGVEAAVTHLFRRFDHLRKVVVYPRYGVAEDSINADAIPIEGAMSPAKRERIRQAIVRNWDREHPQTAKPMLLTRDRVDRLAALEHVQEVVPSLVFNCRAVFAGQRQRDVEIISTGRDNPQLVKRLVAGEFPLPGPRRTALVHEYLLYRWGLRGDDDVRQALGKPIRLELEPVADRGKIAFQVLTMGKLELSEKEQDALAQSMRRLRGALGLVGLPDDERAVLKKFLWALPGSPTKHGESPPALVADFTIVGVFREWTRDEEGTMNWAGEHWLRGADVVLPIGAMEPFLFQSPDFASQGFREATVVVDREENVRAVTKALTRSGLNANSLVDVIDQFRTNVLLITAATALVAGAVLLVAALGITNTMIMSILERTHEIGVMKAVGARDRDVQLIFLVEGALIGALGAGIGLLAGWLASFPGDAIARHIMEQRNQEPLGRSLFVFPAWLVLGIPALACLVTTLAAVYPARRAARVDPIIALRHE